MTAPPTGRPSFLKDQIRRRPAGGSRALFAAALLALSGALALPAAAQTPDPVWSAIMTVGTTGFGGHGYDVDEDKGGSLTDDDFEYSSATYTVTYVELDVLFGVSFGVLEEGLPEEDTLTLEIDGHAFPFEDRTLEEGGSDLWVWAVPTGLDADDNADLPIGSHVVVCLRTATQVCPTTDVPSALSVKDVSAEEGEDLIFTVALSPPSTETVTVDWATSGGTATSGTDFTAGTGTLTFTAGVTEQTFTVATIEDVTDQKNETFTVTLSNATNATISGATATGTIKDDDAPPLVAWSTVMTVAEVYGDPSHGYSENNGGELADADFQYDSATYTVEEIYVTSFESVSFRVDEEGLPQDEILTLVIDGHELPFSESDAYGALWKWDVPEGLNDPVNDLPVGNSVVVCLRNGTGVCPARALTVTDVSAEEGEDLTFTATLWQASTETVTVAWATSEGTATSGTDFTAGTGTLTFTAGVTEQTVTVATIEDMTDEDHETFTVTLSNPTSGTITGAPATGMIVDDDGTSPVWSATMTVGTTQIGGHGYQEKGRGGSLSDDDFAYGLTATTYTTYVVRWVVVEEGRGVYFVVDTAGLPLDNTLTLEFGGHEFPFEDRNVSGSSATYLAWAVPEGLNDPENDLPIGSQVVVCLRTAAQVCPTGSIVTPTTDPVWSTTMTAGDTPLGHGYDRTDLDAPTIGALDDDNFDYGSSSYGVLALDVATNVVRFVVAETGLPTNEILTLELGRHALAFSDRHNAISGQSRWYWTVPAALDDLETEFPVGSTATVCLRTATQVCPTGSIVTPPVTPPPNPTLSVGDAAGTEGGDVTFTATLSATATADVMATWTASIESDDTAVLADLGTTTTGPVMVTAGQTTGTFMVPTAPDATNEGNETFTVTLSSVSSNAQLAADATATGTIVNDDQPTVGFKEERVIVLEGAAIISFLVELDEASTVPITVDWETRAGSAEADVDYTAASGTLTFAAGDTEETTVDEDAGTVTLTLTASASATAAYMIDYATEDGTAEAGTDYTAASGQVTFPAEETEQTITITVLDDAADEDREDFKVRLSNATAQRIDLPADPARVLIEDNDDPPTVTVADGTATEGDKVEFTVTLSALSGRDVEVDYATTETDPQSAVSGMDFTAASGTLEIEAGNRTGTIEVQTTEDDASESAETFTLTISNPDNATLGAKVTATGTINDDANAAPTFSSSAEFDAAENQTAAGTVLATDGDTEDEIEGYAITGGADQGKFSIHATSGALTFKAAPNFEDPDDANTDGRYQVTVQATSGTGTRVKTATQAITVTLSGLSENTAYQVQVRATNAEGTGDWSASGSGTTDANAAPSFTSDAEFDAAENQTSAGTVVATDGDSDDDITGYAITGGADQGKFSIHATSGALTFKAAPNFEDPDDANTDGRYQVTVEATSGTGTREKTATQAITVTVTDVGGEAPSAPSAPSVAAASLSSLTVSWSAPANAGPAITDYDVQYRAGTTGNWTDGGHAGTATTATLSGLSENTAYQVQVRATNAEGTGDWSASGTGTTDANAAPSFTSDAEFDAAENQTSAGTVVASDGDTEDEIEGYAITGGADQGKFSIHSTSGALTFKAAPNFEDPDDANTDGRYQVTVQATSGTGTREKTATQAITVTVTDDDTEKPGKPNAPTVSAASVTSLTVSWSAPANAGPAVTDYDVQYRTKSPVGDWTVVADTTSTANDAVTLTHTATSTDGNYSGITIAGVSVTVTDNDTTTPAVTLVLSDGSIGENGGVSTVTATVSPASAAAFTVTVAAAAVSPAVAADFRLSANRVLSFAENATTSTGTVTITGVDNDVDAADKTVTVSGTVSATSVTAPANRTLTLEDDDAAPVMTLAVSPAVIAEAAGSSTVTVRITNGVTFAEDQEIRLSFSGTAEKDTDYRVESERLNLMAGDGSVTTPVTSVDDEVVDVDETILITATHDRNAVGTQQTITITDDDAAPVVTTTSPLLVEENETAVATLMATDTDDRLEDLEWEIAGGTDRSKFTLTAGGELAFKAAKDYENPDDANRDGDYEITVRVSDGANRAEADFIVRLQDVDDIAPVFSAAVADGSTLTLAYNEALDSSSVPGTDAFTVTGGNATRTVSGVRVIGSAVELTLDPAVEHGQTGIRVSYTVPTGTGATPIQDTAGNDADSFNNRQVSNNTGDTTGPAVETVSITSSAGSDATYAAGETIQATVTFDETVVVTGTPRLTLKVGGRDRTADYQSVTGGAVRFEYQVVAGDSDPDGVSIEANRLSRGGGTIRDGSQNDAVLEHDALADNTQHKVDGVAPVLVDPDGAVVNGATLTLTYDEALNGSSRPATSAYTVSGGSETRTVTRVRVSGSAVMLTLVPAVEHGETDLRVSYRPGANPIQDLVGNEAGVLTDQEVDNRTPDTTAPSIEGIELTSDPGNDETYAAGEVIAVRVRYNEPVRVDTTGGTPTLNLTVGNRSKTAGARSGLESTEVVFVYEVERGEVDEDGVSIPRGRISLNGGTIRDDGNNNAALSHDGLTADSGHRVDGVEPKLQSATVHASRLALSYDELLDENSIPSALDFTVVVAGNDRPVIQVQVVSGNAVTLRLSSPVTAGETVTVSYRPGFNPVRDQVGNAVEALTDEPALPPLITISATEGASSVTEGTAVQFTLTREEPTAAALTVGLSVTERGEVIQTAGSYQPPEEVTFTVGDTTATLTVLTEDDEQQEGDGAVIATLQPGAGYRLGGASTQSAQVTVEDDEGGAPPGPIGPGLPPVPNPVPSAPRNLEALGGDEQVTLFWEVPEDDGGFPITDYEYLISRSGRGWISTESTDLTHTVTELTNSRVYVFQVRAVSAAGAGASSNRVEVTPGVGRLEFAHFANGSSITSELVLVNVFARPIRPWLYFYNREGERIAAESVVEVTEELEVTEDGSLTVQSEMQPLETLTISTHGQGEVVAGSVTVLSNGPLGGVLRFDLPGVGVAGVGAGQPLRDALFPARRQAGGISTAAAIRNLEAEELVVSCQLMQEGAVLEEVEIELQAKGQDGRFIEEVFTATDTSNFVGMVRCTAPAGKLFAGVAVELDAGQGVFTTLPVLPLDRTVFRGGEYALDFAHFANGASITSDLVLVNVSIRPSRPAGPYTTPIPPTRPSFYFYDRAGERLAAQSVVEVAGDLELAEDGSLAAQSEMQPLEAVTISTHGRGEVVAGSVRVVAEGPLGGVLRFDLPGVGVAGVGTGQPLTDALFPARRQAGGISTAAAIRNLEAEELVVSCRLMQEGAVLEEVDIELEVNGQDGRFIEEVFTRTDTSDFVGLVRCTAEGEFTGVAVELDAGKGIFTTLPVVPVPERMSQQ